MKGLRNKLLGAEIFLYELNIADLDKKLTGYDETRRFIIVFTKA